MTDDRLEKLNGIDPTVLSEVARQDLGAAAFEVRDWSVTPLSHEKVIETTGGLYCFSGRGWDGSEIRSWSVVLKIVNDPQDECQEPRELCYWRRELLAYKSGMLVGLPRALRAPRCHGVSEGAHEAWIWLENIRETGEPTWTLAHFQRAARQLGLFAGAYLAGTSLPDQPWLCGSLFRSILGDDEWWARFMNPDTPVNAWQKPIVQKVFPEPLRSRILQIWAEKWRFITANDYLPRVFCHNDAHRRNLMLRTGVSGQEELIGIDWAFCGPGGLGNDLGELVGTRLSYFAVEPAQAVELEAAVFEGYLAGLRDAGWSGNEGLARLGYTISLALWWGATLPCEAALLQPGESKINAVAKYGRPLEAVLPGWSTLSEFALDRSEEARYWMNRFL